MHRRVPHVLELPVEHTPRVGPGMKRRRLSLPLRPLCRCLILPALLAAFPSASHAAAESFWGSQERYTQKHRVRYLLLLPAHYDPNKEYELWLNLHGSPGCASHAVYQYRVAAQQHDVILLAPQASGWSAHSYTRPDGKPDVYRAWDMRRDRDRILEVLDEVTAGYPISKQRIALLGFSSGCEMGWRLLAERPSEFYFFGGVANFFKNGKPPVSAAALRLAAAHTPQFYAAGKADAFAGPMFNVTARKLKSEGFELRTANPAGVGHDLPPSIQTPLLQFMDEVRSRQQREFVNHVAARSAPRPASIWKRVIAGCAAAVALTLVWLRLRRHGWAA